MGSPGASGPVGAGYASPTSEYRPGATGYNPPASDYRPDSTRYQPPSYPSPASSPFRSLNPSAQSANHVMPEDVPYRPGSVTGYPQRATNVAGSSSGTTNPFNRLPSSRSETGVTPTTGYSTGSGSYLR